MAETDAERAFVDGFEAGIDAAQAFNNAGKWEPHKPDEEVCPACEALAGFSAGVTDEIHGEDDAA